MTTEAKKFELGPRQKAWLEALKSGKYRHGKCALEKIVDGETRNCCLGVLCIIEGIEKSSSDEENVSEFNFGYAWNSGVLGISLTEEIGLRSQTGLIENENKSLVGINDYADSFAPIIELFEQHPERVFTKSV
jgi:hypothetical protein